MMVLQPIVEGAGEVLAFPVLLRRLLAEAAIYDVRVATPILRKRSQLAKGELLRKAVELARKGSACDAILILFDSDDDLPCVLGPEVERWAVEEAGGTPCKVVLACKEYEAWFLATIESLRGKRGIQKDASAHPDPERPRDAKGQLEARMEPGRSYSEREDQPAFTSAFDMATAYARCRSFRRMAAAFGGLVADMGVGLGAWPPVSWEKTGAN